MPPNMTAPSQKNYVRSSSAPVNRKHKSILRKSNNDTGVSKSFMDDFGTMEMKKVWFDTVEVKYHKVILGDNPSVSDGAPITIHWKSYFREVLDINEFETKDPTSCRVRKHKSSRTNKNDPSTFSRRDLKIDVQDRAALLLKSGYSLSDIGRSTQEAQEIQRERLKSANSSKWDGLNAALEGSGKVFKKMIRLDQMLLGNGSSNNKTSITPAA
mmetsp:Transcript_17123/g.27778  ORF Transcript_17123/g.27778 Transcript_17123/m.27778 type:complete len:213 (-) Transcript_17123:88-726(-)